MKTARTQNIASAYDYVISRFTNKDITNYFMNNILHKIFNMDLITKRITLINFFTNYYNDNEFNNIKLSNIKCDVGVCPICFKRRHIINNYMKNDDYNYNITLSYVEEEDEEEEEVITFNNYKLEPKNNMCIECSNNKYLINKREKRDYVNIDIDIYISLDNHYDLTEFIYNHDINDILEELEFRIRDNPLNTIIINYNSNNIMYEINKSDKELLRNLRVIKYE